MADRTTRRLRRGVARKVVKSTLKREDAIPEAIDDPSENDTIPKMVQKRKKHKPNDDRNEGLNDESTLISNSTHSNTKPSPEPTNKPTNPKDETTVMRQLFLTMHPTITKNKATWAAYRKDADFTFNLPTNKAIWKAYNTDTEIFDLTNEAVVFVLGSAYLAVNEGVVVMPSSNVLEEAREAGREEGINCEDTLVFRIWRMKEELKRAEEGVDEGMAGVHAGIFGEVNDMAEGEEKRRVWNMF